MHYYPGWEPPEDDGRDWITTQCPVHSDGTPSAGISYSRNAFVCHGCGYSGDYLKIIRREEGCTRKEAYERAEAIASSCGIELPPQPKRKRRRRIPKPKRFAVP